MAEEILGLLDRRDREIASRDGVITGLRRELTELAARMAELERITRCSVSHPPVGDLLPDVDLLDDEDGYRGRSATSS